MNGSSEVMRIERGGVPASMSFQSVSLNVRGAASKSSKPAPFRFSTRARLVMSGFTNSFMN